MVYPKFYPGLLGHVPSEDYLSSPNILPRVWLSLKEKVVLPYLHNCIHDNSAEYPASVLQERIREWYRLNRN
jgi:hypothetical protein